MEFVEGRVAWVGAIDESMVVRNDQTQPSSRQEVSRLVLLGDHVWRVVRPGRLRHPGTEEDDTVYQGDRPWVVIGGPHECGVLAIPLNALGQGAHHHYQCEVKREDLDTPDAKDSKLELGHLWSFPSGQVDHVGNVRLGARERITAKLRSYYPVA
jgi:hypothetical protein